MKGPKIGIALGGGGARGVAHIGVLKVLEDENIPIHCIAGTSIGAIIGAAYAFNPDTEKLQAAINAFVESEAYANSGLSLFARNQPVENFFGQVAKYVRERIVINLAHSRESIVSSGRLRRIIKFVLQDANIEHAKIPLAIVATDLRDGRDVVFRYGGVRKAALASASIPGFLPPVNYMGFHLVDGAVTSPVPVEAAFGLGADIVLAIDVGQHLEPEPDAYNIVDIIFRTNSITGTRLKALTTGQADVVIQPEVGNVHWADFSDIPSLVDAGACAARAKLPEIAKKVRQATPLWQKLLTAQQMIRRNSNIRTKLTHLLTN